MSERLTPSTTSLVFFDMINCFVHTGKEERIKFVKDARLVDHCVRLRDAAKKAGVGVFYAGSAHREDGKDYAPSVTDTDTELRPWPEGPRLMGRPPGLDRTPEVEVIPELAPDPEDFVITKHRWSAFAGTSLDLLLRGIGTDTIVLAGGATDIGIASTAFGARDMGYNLVIPREACQTHRPDCQEFFMTRVFPRMARMVSVDEAVALLAGS